MKSTVNKSLIVFLLIFFSGLAVAQSQTPVVKSKIEGYVIKKPLVQALDRRGMLIDSLSAFVDFILIQQDSLKQSMRLQKERMDSSVEAMQELSAENLKLKGALKEAQGDTLQSDHTNSILFIFNVVVGIFLLIALVWMIMRKRNDEETNDGETKARPKQKANSVSDESFDYKLDRIQKLGSLRDKGLLTEDEFNLQKKQILGE